MEAVIELTHIQFGVPHVAAEARVHALPVIIVEPIFDGMRLGIQSTPQHQTE
jgi:hypothetical protein